MPETFQIYDYDDTYDPLVWMQSVVETIQVMPSLARLFPEATLDRGDVYEDLNVFEYNHAEFETASNVLNRALTECVGPRFKDACILKSIEKNKAIPTLRLDKFSAKELETYFRRLPRGLGKKKYVLCDHKLRDAVARLDEHHDMMMLGCTYETVKAWKPRRNFIILSTSAGFVKYRSKLTRYDNSGFTLREEMNVYLNPSRILKVCLGERP